MHFLCYQMNYNIISESGFMLPEYGICMSLIRSTSAALCICDNCSITFSDQSRSGSECTMVHDRDTLNIGRAASRKNLTVNVIVDILCYIWYLPLFFAGPLMTWENFHRQVCSLIDFEACSYSQCCCL